MTDENVQHKSAVEARDHFFEAFEEGTLSGRWLACIWWIADGKIEHRFTKRGFPDDDFPKAIDMLKEWSPVKELPDGPLPSVVQFEETPPAYQIPERLTPAEENEKLRERMTDSLCPDVIAVDQPNVGGQRMNEVINEIPLPQGPPKPGPGDTQL